MAKCTLALVAALIDVAARYCCKHEAAEPVRWQCRWYPGCNCPWLECCAPTNRSASFLGNERALLERVEYSIDRVVLHGQEETRRQLRSRRAGIEQGRRRVCERTQRHQVVRFDGGFNVAAVNPARHAHQHVLRTFGDFAVQLEQVRAFECLETKVVVRIIAVVDDGPVDALLVLQNEFKHIVGNQRRVESGLGFDVPCQLRDGLDEILVGVFVQIGNGNARRSNP